MTQLIIPPNEIIIRPFHPDDADQQYAIVSDPRVAEMLLQVPSMELASTREWAKKEVNGRHRLVAAWNGRLLGAIHISQNMRPRLMHSGHLGMMVHPDAWGQGIGKLLLRTLIDSAEATGFWTLQAGIFPENVASVTLHEKLGFRVVGRREKLGQQYGRWRDVLFLERRSHTVGV